MFSAVAAACQINWRLCTEGQRGALNQTESKLREVGAIPDDIKQFYKWWCVHDWRGQKGEPPEPHQIREEWGRFEEWQDNQNGTGKSEPELVKPAFLED